MTVQQRDLPSVRRWRNHLVPLCIGFLIAGGLCALLVPAINNARNAAFSSATL